MGTCLSTMDEPYFTLMHAYFAPVNGKRKVFVLYGLGGAGKTQVGCKFVEMSQFDSETQR